MAIRGGLTMLTLSLGLALSACGSDPQAEAENADDFAARIGGDSPAQTAQDGTPDRQVSATAAPVREGAAPGPYEAGTQTDPRSVKCGATETAFALGQRYNAELGQRIAKAAPSEVRVVQPGSATTEEYVAQRLNVMLDTGGIVRDLRCG